MRIKFTCFPEEFRRFKKEFINKFNEIGSKGDYILGKELTLFEKNICNFLKVKHTLGVGNWTEGTIMLMKALNFKKNDEIITVSNSFIATCGALAYSGQKPILVDVSDDLNIDTALIEKKITKKTKAIMPVHLSGIPSDLKKIKKICKKYKLLLIEDAAHAFGTKYNDKFLGTIGDVGIFSLHPRKNFHVLGDGGLIVTNNTNLYKKLKILRNHGLINRNESVVWGTNSRLDNLQAAFGNIMLKKIVSINKRQFDIAKIYNSKLAKFVKLPVFEKKISNPTFHQYIIRTKKRNQLKKYLKKKGIDTAIHYPKPIHLQKAYKKLFGNIDLPKTEKFKDMILSLPIHPYLKTYEVNYIIKQIQNFFHEK